MEDSKLNKQQRAEKRIKELKEFYNHLTSYIIVNLVISIAKVMRNLNNGEGLKEAIWDFSTFAVWLFWGVGLAFHAVKVFSLNSFFGKNWEAKQIQKFMQEEAEEVNKYSQ